MDNTELCKKLRELSRKGSPFRRTICKAAAQRIVEQADELERVKMLLSDIYQQLPKLDLSCDYCDYGQVLRPCIENDELIHCEDCSRDCFCKDCGPDGSKWVNSKMREVLELDKNMPPVTNQSKGET